MCDPCDATAKRPASNKSSCLRAPRLDFYTDYADFLGRHFLGPGLELRFCWTYFSRTKSVLNILYIYLSVFDHFTMISIIFNVPIFHIFLYIRLYLVTQLEQTFGVGVAVAHQKVFLKSNPIRVWPQPHRCNSFMTALSN